MARIKKQGLDYFPMDTNFMSDIRYRLIMKQEGEGAIAVLFALISNIYGGEGYYVRVDQQLVAGMEALMYQQTTEQVVRIIESSVRLGIFDEEMYQQHHVLTSRDIQRQFLFSTRRRNNSAIVDDFCLVSPNEEAPSAVSRITAVKRQRLTAPQQTEIFEEAGAEIEENEPEVVYEEEQFEATDIENKTEDVLVENTENVNKNTQNVHIGTYSIAKQSINTPSSPPTKGEDVGGNNPSVEVPGRTHAGTPLHQVVSRVLKPAPAKRARTGRPATQEEIDCMVPPHDGVERNYSGLLENFMRYRLDPPLQKYLIHKSDFGRKGHPIWKVLLEMSTMGPRLQSPPAYLLSQLKKFEV